MGQFPLTLFRGMHGNIEGISIDTSRYCQVKRRSIRIFIDSHPVYLEQQCPDGRWMVDARHGLLRHWQNQPNPKHPRGSSRWPSRSPNQQQLHHRDTTGPGHPLRPSSTSSITTAPLRLLSPGSVSCHSFASGYLSRILAPLSLVVTLLCSLSPGLAPPTTLAPPSRVRLILPTSIISISRPPPRCPLP